MDLAKTISLVPQEHIPYFKFTVTEMVLCGRMPYLKGLKIPTEQDYDVIEKVMLRIGIFDLKDRYYVDLSGGEKRLVLIAMAISQQTKIVLFDEPTTSLDLKNSILIMKEIKKLANEFKKIIIVAIHDINQALQFSDQSLLLFSINSYTIGKTQKILTKDNLVKLYGVNLKIIEDNGTKVVLPFD
jgi:iron complex transport system ATP-binding protein